MNGFVRSIAALLFLVISLSEHSWAADAPPPNPYSGDIWTHSTLTGDWGGVRNQLAERGLTFDVRFTHAAQGIVHGGKDIGWQYGGGRVISISVWIRRSSDFGLADF